MNQIFPADALELKLIEEALCRFNSKYGSNYTYQDLLRRPTLRNLLKFSNSNLSFFQETNYWLKIDLSKEPPPINHLKKTEKIKNLLITGSTGFLGAHTLIELWKNTKLSFFLLIQAASNEQALEKLKKTLYGYKLLDISNDKRINIVLGDLSKVNIGLDLNNYSFLTQHLDAICHIGAHVHHVYDYMSLRHANVLATHELVSIASTEKIKHFFYVSSIVAASKEDEKGTFYEEINLDFLCQNEDGYTQSKFASEHYLAKSSQNGLPVSIFRPSNITGRLSDGVCNPDKNHFLSLVKGCIQMGKAPDWKMKYNLVPVDLVSQIIHYTIMNQNQGLQIMNITNDHFLEWSYLISWLNRQGYPIDLILEDEWSELYLAKVNRSNALFPFISLYSNRTKNSESHRFEYNPSSNYSLNYKNETTNKALKRVGQIWPQLDSFLLEKYFRYLKKVQFLPTP